MKNYELLIKVEEKIYQSRALFKANNLEDAILVLILQSFRYQEDFLAIGSILIEEKNINHCYLLGTKGIVPIIITDISFADSNLRNQQATLN